MYNLITVVDIPTSLLEGLETEEPLPHSESAPHLTPGIVYSVPMSWRVEIISGGDVIHKENAPVSVAKFCMSCIYSMRQKKLPINGPFNGRPFCLNGV